MERVGKRVTPVDVQRCYLHMYANGPATQSQYGGRILSSANTANGLAAFHGHLGHQRGHGFGSFLSRNLVPLFMRFVAPQALRFGRNVLDDLSQHTATNSESHPVSSTLSSTNFRSSLRNRGLSAIKDIGRDIATHVLTGKGRARARGGKKKGQRRGSRTAMLAESAPPSNAQYRRRSSKRRTSARHSLIGGGCPLKGKQKKRTSRKKSKPRKKRVQSKSVKRFLALNKKFAALQSP